MISKALELVIQLLDSMLKQYHSPSLIVVRQVLDLARLGLTVALLVEDEASVRRLHNAVVHHELLRCMDYYSKSPEVQAIIGQEISNYCGLIDPVLLRKGEQARRLNGEIFLITNLSKPGSRPNKSISLPSEAENDLIVMPLEAFLKKVVDDYNRASAVYANPEAQKKDLHTEKRCHDMMHGTKSIIHSMQKRLRRSGRRSVPGASLFVAQSASKAFARVHDKDSFVKEETLGSDEKKDLWSVINVGKQGLVIESLERTSADFQIGHVVNLIWVGKKSYGPNIGRIRWKREIKHNEWRVGIEYFEPDCDVVRGTVIGRNEHVNSGSWALLIERRDPSRVWFPEPRVKEGMRFFEYIDGKGGIRCHVIKVLSKHGNYCLCEVEKDKQQDNKGMLLD